PRPAKGPLLSHWCRALARPRGSAAKVGGTDSDHLQIRTLPRPRPTEGRSRADEDHEHGQKDPGQPAEWPSREAVHRAYRNLHASAQGSTQIRCVAMGFVEQPARVRKLPRVVEAHRQNSLADHMRLHRM